MGRKASVVIEKDEHGFYACCSELKGCQSQGNTLEEAVANIKEAIELHRFQPRRASGDGRDL
jgi:predicted RNase H-like HicB family nuclease